jgi:hypothetical protein
MTFLPIVDRELRVRARLKSTYRFRLGAAVIAISIVGLLLVLDEGFRGRGNFGSGTFGTLAWLAYLYCLLEGLRNTADCLSEEKRAGTIGLLFLTDLRGYDVVFGKLMATSLNSFYALLAVFPPLAITLIQGGVTGGEFWRLVLNLVNTLFFSLAAGICVSAVSRDERRAWGGTLGVIAFFAVVPPLMESVSGLPELLRMPISPTSGFFGLRDAEYGMNPGRFWGAFWSIHLLSWLLLVAASYTLPRTWQDAPAVAGNSWTQRWFSRRGGSGAGKLAAARQELLEVNPVIWLVSRGEREALLLWTVAVVAGALVAGVWLFAMGSLPVGIALLVAVILLHMGLAMWVATEACHLFAGARDSGALELLLSTPLSIREVISGYLLGLKRLFYRPVVMLLALEGLLLAGQLFVMSTEGKSVRDLSIVVAAVGLCVAVSIMDLFAVARYGMWMGLCTKNPGKAITKTVLHVLLLPLLGVFCVWPLVGLVKNMIFISYAQEKLRRYFRAVVTERYGLGEESRYVGELSPRQRRGQLPPVLRR